MMGLRTIGLKPIWLKLKLVTDWRTGEIYGEEDCSPHGEQGRTGKQHLQRRKRDIRNKAGTLFAIDFSYLFFLKLDWFYTTEFRLLIISKISFKMTKSSCACKEKLHWCILERSSVDLNKSKILMFKGISKVKLFLPLNFKGISKTLKI